MRLRVRATRRRVRLGAGLITVVTVARRSGLGTVLGLGAVRRRADGKLRNLGVVGGTPVVLPRLVDDLAMLARLTVDRSVADVVVVPVITLLRLVDGKAVARSVGAVLGNVLRSTLAITGLGDPDVLAITVGTGVRLEDVDNASALVSVVAVSVGAHVDGSDGLGLGGGGAVDGGCEDGGDGGLVGHSSSDDIGESNIRAAEVDVDSEEDGVGNARLAAAEAAAASKRSITTTELGVITRALNVARVEVDALSVVAVDLVTTVAVGVVNTKVAATDTEAGTLVEVHGAGRLGKLKGRETVGGTDTAEENKVVDGTGEASSRGSGGGGSSLSASGSDSLALRVGGSTIGVGVDLSLSGSLGVSLGTGGDNGLALRVGSSTLRVGVDLGVGGDDGVGDSSSGLTLAVGESSLSDDSSAGLGVSVSVATVTAAVTTTAVKSFASSNLDVTDSESSRVGAARLNELKVGRGVTSRSAGRGTATNAIGGLEALGEDAHTVGSDIKGAATVGTLAAVVKELNKDIEQDVDQIAESDASGENSSNGEGSDTVRPSSESNSD